MAKKETSSKPTSARLLKHTRPAEAVSETSSPSTNAASSSKPAGVFAEAARSLSPDQIEEPKQRPLIPPADGEAPAEPVVVQNGRLLATYVGLGLDRDPDDEKLLHLDFSFPLEKIHNGHLPARVKDAWEFLKMSGNPLVQVGGIPEATVAVFEDPKDKKPLLKIVGAVYKKAVIQLVEETGKGKSKTVTRFKFRLEMERKPHIVDFAAWHDGEQFWLSMEQTQGELGT